MKKCPYCAEEIQDDAIKCKHCGEWLSMPVGADGLDKSDDCVESRHENDKMDYVEDTPKPIVPPAIDPPKQSEISSVKTLTKKPGKYGWGWFLFLVLLTNYDMRSHPVKDYTLSLIWDGSIVLLLVVYFILRWKFIKRWNFPGSKAWKAGLAAGLCTYLLTLFVLGVLFFFDERSLNTTIATLNVRYRERVTFFKQKEGTFNSKFISAPQSRGAINQNIRTIDEVLSYQKEKQRFLHDMFNDYGQTLAAERRQKGNRSWKDSTDEVLSALDKLCNQQAKAWELLRSHYLTGEEKDYEGYTAAYRQAENSGREFRELVKGVFNIAANH